MNVSIFIGDIADAPAEAICTSTNPRLSLMMGTGASVRDKGGWDVMRACEAIVRTGGGHLHAGSVHATTPGTMPCKTLIHCVASDQSHMTSAHIIQTCVRNALACAERKGCRSIAMPLFGTGHARYKFEPALLAMREALRSASARVEQVVIVIPDPARAAEAEKIIASRE
jgi:O-acetyl-ADP-ribose deacetylase